MPKFIVFKTEDWPEVVRSLRCRSSWREEEVEQLIDEAIQILTHREGKNEALVQLRDALHRMQPHPTNPGRWYFSVDVAEAFAEDDVLVLSKEATEKLNKEFITSAGAQRPFQPRGSYTSSKEYLERNRDRLLLLGVEQGALKGMKAFPLPEGTS